jgi:hypothetical protein
MSEIKRVKIGSIIESQIPEFLSVESPLFMEFLEQYYKSLEHQSGSIDIISNITQYKNSKKFNNIDLIEQTILTSDILSFAGTINVESTRGWPDSYGLLKINDEIITYLSKTETSFQNCIRGFSGIENLDALSNPEFAVFSSTQASEHFSGNVVKNLSNLFLVKFFEKFKYEFLPGFEARDFYENISIENIAYKIKDLYASKGTDQSYKLLFKILYGSDIEIIKPQDFTLSPSSNSYFITKNILVEKISGGNPIDIKGNFLFQNVPGIGTVSASIFNVEFRPVGNKQFYEISLDSTSFTGNFQVSGKTRILEDVQVNSDNVLVDSTVGFANSGTILVKPKNSDFIKINYTGKNINQFTGVTNITKPLDFGLDLVEEKFAFSYIGLGNTSKVEFRVVNVIDNIDFSKTSNLRVGDTISLSGFGRDLYNNYEFNSWIYNLPTNHNIRVISQVDSTKYRVNLFDKVYFYIGEKILLVNNLGDSIEANILSVEYSTSDLIKKYSNRILIEVLNPETFNVLASVRVQKQIYKSKHQSNYFGDIGNIPSGVQNTYIDSNEEYFYVTSSGLPNYPIFSTDGKKNVSTNVGTSITDTFNVFNHNLLSGELIYYQPDTSSGILTGLYFVTKVDNNRIKLSYSKSDVFSKKYIKTDFPITNDNLYKSGYENKTITHQKLLKKFPFTQNKTKTSFDDLNARTTFNRELGLLVNGVEILSPTLFDENIYYGSISSIDVTNPGEDYDVIDVPPIEINDETGTGVKAHLNISGSVREVKILNAGYGYQEKPKITISGGNGTGCILESNFVTSRVSAGFKADTNVVPLDDTIQFLTSIPFEDGEEIIYDSNKNSNLPGIINGSTYFVGILGDDKIKLFNTRTDALQKVNEIDIVGVSSGFHFITTLKNKNTFTKIYVKNPGQGYSNRKVKVPSILSADNRTSGINTFDSYVFAQNHGFSDGEYVTYNFSDTPVSGLSSLSYYQVKIIDVNKFRLCDSGFSTSLNDENYVKNKFVKFNSLGIGTHTIGYPPIEIKVESKSSIGSTTIIKSELNPIVLGSIEDVYIEDGGIGYGCTDIINYHRRPNTGIASVTSEAILKPIIIDGSIVDVKIINRGRGFRKNSEIIVAGVGNYAQLEPIVENGRLVNVNIVFGGVGYDSKNTTLILKNRGKNARFLTNLTEWKINQVIKSKNIISNEDDGILHESKNPNLGLQFINFYVPKKIRYQLSDNFTDDNKENSGILNHSPILGYAYDGNPIYGPYAYNTPTGGFIRRMNSSYILNVDFTPGKRPPVFENGFFVNDYQYDGSGDLDQHNGRFCITPEYPDGTYAYFYSIDVSSSNESIPKYPYIIGPYFYNKPIRENFLPAFNQDFDIFNTNLTRNVGPYYLNRPSSYYDLIDKVLDEYKQEFSVTSINSGKIESISIFSAGDDYKINDLVDIDITDTGGIQSNIVVSELDGREIKSFTTINDLIPNLEFFVRLPDTVVTSTFPHGIKNGQPVLISGMSTITASKFEGIQRAQVSEKESELMEDINTEIVTGVSTFITLKDISGFKVNDFIGIGTEILLITEIDTKQSGFYVNRLQNTGIHSAGIDNVVLLPREFKIATGEVKDITFQNYTTFFDPKVSVGMGSTGSLRTVVGFGTTSLETRFIPPRSIYLPNHKFYTGQPLLYNSGSGFAGTSLYVNNVGSAVSFKLEDNQIVYAVNFGQDYIGLSTIGFTSSTGIGTNFNSVEFWDQDFFFGVIGAAHSLTTLNPKITGTLQKTLGIVTTTRDHNLQSGDIIKFNITTDYNEVIKVIFDPVNRKVLMREIQFSDSDVLLSESSIDISSYSGDIKTGDKVVYISQSPINGLTHYGVYYVLKTSFSSIQLCQYRSDIDESNFINFSSTGGPEHKLYFINPQISCIRTTKIEFDLSDSSLLDFDLQFYFDVNFVEKINERRGFFVSRSGVSGNSGAKVILDLSAQFFPIYYNLFPKGSSDENKKQISTDVDVKSNNKISIINHQLNTTFKIVDVFDKTFTFYNNKKLTDIEKQILNENATKFSYKTTSTSALGPISKLKINFPGQGYKKLPKIRSIKSNFGKNAVIKIISPSIGRVETFSRVKDGFDYPTDPTLSPSLSVPTIIGIKDIRTIDYIGIITGGRRYNSPPKLIVKDDIDGIDLNANISGGAITSVDIIKNSTSISSPLEILPIYNSNGYEIDFISVNDNLVTLELTNTPDLTPFTPIGFGVTEYTYPFQIGDKIFIENCRLTNSTLSQANFNSSSYNYSFFDVVGVSTENNTITYDMSGIATGSFGTYDDQFNLGVVINKNDMPIFDMILKDDVNYTSNEKISSSTFSGVVMENGWDGQLNQMRLKNIFGEINVGDKIFGETSRINGTVEYFDLFNLYATLGVSRDKTSSIDLSSGILNDYSQRISDNFYYQKFSYSIKGNIPYNIWRESVRSIVHPSGFKEFSDLEIITKPTLNEVNLGIAKSSNMKPRLLETDSFTFINVDEIVPLNAKTNFARVYEEETLPDGSTQNIFFDEGIDLTSYLMNKTNKVILVDDISDQFDGTADSSLSKSGLIVGLTTFKLKNKGTPLFEHQFTSNNIDIINDTFTIINHNFQSGQELLYTYSGGLPVGIATTSYVIGQVDTLLNVHDFDGTAIFENGYNVAISTEVSGVVPSGPTGFVLYTQLVGFNTTGLGTDALFNVAVSYSGTGSPLSTSIILTYGGSGYYVGEQVSISGTYFGGTSPSNDLSFVISKTGPTVIQSEANQSYLSVPSSDLSGATFDVSRDSSGAINYLRVLNGGSGYDFNSIISIAGTYIGGTDFRDDLLFSPLELGTKILPTSVFVFKLNDNQFKLSGLSTSVFLNLTDAGTATHYLTYKEPNSSIVVTIDGIIQKALTRKSLEVSFASSVSSASTTILDISSGISSLTTRDIINIDNELVSIKTIGITSENQIEVTRGYFGSVATSHTVGSSGTVLTGNFNIVGDVIYFDTSPYGKVGPVGLETGSRFSGRVFSRKFDPSIPNDKNILFDDISLSFTGIAATEFTIKSGGQTTDIIYNNVNSSTEINNNPILLINNVFQDPRNDYTIDGSGTNVIRFLSGTPSAGKISKVGISSSYGYIPRVGAAATIVVSSAGTISDIILTGAGSGYRSSPVVSIASTIGVGASVISTVSTAGTVTGFIILNPGTGYTSTSLPEVVIGIPTGYSNLSLGYAGGSSGVGQDAKLTVEVGMGSSIISYKFDQPGIGYKVGDQLVPIGIPTSTNFRYDSLNISNVQYDNLTGVTTVTTTSTHNINEDDYVILTGIAFTCGYDEVGIETFSYDNATGICTVVTYSPHGLLRTDVDANKTSDEVFLFNLPFSCSIEHTGVTTTIFPDGTSSYGRVFPVLSAVGLNTFTINAGISTIPHVFEGWPEIGITTFSYYQVTGLSTATTSINHEFVVGDKITLAGLAFTCDSQYVGLTTTIFPDGTSQYGYTFTITSVNSPTEFEFLAGISTIVHYYNGGGYAKKVPTSQRVLRYTDDSTDGAYDFRVVSIGSTNEFTVMAGSISTIPHYYTQGGIVTFKQFEQLVLTVEEVETDSFSGFYPGQFVQFDDISPFFNGFRRKFTLSTTINGVKQVLGLRVPEGSDLNISNNIFIYINDILQDPNLSYTLSGTRISFTEPPKSGSKCVVLYYRGSSVDVELIDPPKTIKPGDKITIQENSEDLFDISQFDRVVKKIVASDQLETFNYYSVGIITDPSKIRPLTWKKQLHDTVINGTLYPKSRPNLQSGIKPFATVIKKIEPEDSVIYVDNAYPLFVDVDQLSEDIRDLVILENRLIESCLVEPVVSTSSTISSFNILDGGVGYSNTQSPKVIISETAITTKDPIFNWSGTTGLSTTYDLKSIKYKGKFVSVGNNSLFSTSLDGITWQVSTVGFGQSSNFNSIEVVGIDTGNLLVSVGSFGQIIQAVDSGTIISGWSQIPLLEDVTIPGFGAVNRVSSGYTGTFNEISYSKVTDTWVTVGAGGSIFVGSGVGTDSFVNRFSETLSDLNSVTFGNEYFVAVGNDGVIRTSNDGTIWESATSPVSTNLNKVIYVNGKFVITGDFGIILQSIDRDSYQIIGNNLGIQNIINIYYNYGFYVIVTSMGELFYSFDLSNWIYRSTLQPNSINDLIFVDGLGSEGRYVAIGSGGTAIYAEPIYNRATAISSVTNGVVTSLQVINPGFGYDINNPPPAIVELDTYQTELVKSFKVIGDHGIIIGVTTYITGTPGIGTTSPKISFTLKSEQYDNTTLGVGYSSLNVYGVTNSQLSKGDYFVITDSNVEIGGDLIGITTFLGGMANYPNSRIGIAKSFLDGVYIVEDVTAPFVGIITVTCNFAPMVDNYVKVYTRGSNNTGIGTNGYYGRYSWAKIYDYQNRILGNPKTFEVFNDNGIIGITSSPKIIRTRTIISK